MGALHWKKWCIWLQDEVQERAAAAALKAAQKVLATEKEEEEKVETSTAPPPSSPSPKQPPPSTSGLSNPDDAPPIIWKENCLYATEMATVRILLRNYTWPLIPEKSVNSFVPTFPPVIIITFKTKIFSGAGELSPSDMWCVIVLRIWTCPWFLFKISKTFVDAFWTRSHLPQLCASFHDLRRFYILCCILSF